MIELDKIIAESTQRIKRRYIHLPTDHGIPTFRERVYCYELYHQMRSVWPINCRYTLNGEVDKRGHPILRDLQLRSTPDLLVHSPGEMASNHAVIEVKSSKASSNGIKKDLQTLSGFKSMAGYTRAIYLLYGTQDRACLLQDIAAVYTTIESRVDVEVWFHAQPGECAQLVGRIPQN